MQCGIIKFPLSEYVKMARGLSLCHYNELYFMNYYLYTNPNSKVFRKLYTGKVILKLRQIESIHEGGGELTAFENLVVHELNVERNGGFYTFNYKFH